jgi:hypothetical protein
MTGIRSPKLWKYRLVFFVIALVFGYLLFRYDIEHEKKGLYLFLGAIPLLPFLYVLYKLVAPASCPKCGSHLSKIPEGGVPQSYRCSGCGWEAPILDDSWSGNP